MSRDRYPESAWVFYFMKKCTKCKVEKQLDQFYKNKRYPDGVEYYCKKCSNENNKKGYKKYYLKNKKERLIKQKQYYNSNREHRLEYQNNYHYKNIEKIKAYNSSPEVKEQQNKRTRERNAKQPWVHRWRNMLYWVLKKQNNLKDKSTHKLLGYSANELKEHLDKQGIDWENDHIDHKIPITWFKKDTPPHIVNDLRNLQPMPAEENKSKGNRFGEADDPSYIQLIKENKYIKEKYKNRI